MISERYTDHTARTHKHTNTQHDTQQPLDHSANVCTSLCSTDLCTLCSLTTPTVRVYETARSVCENVAFYLPRNTNVDLVRAGSIQHIYACIRVTLCSILYEYWWLIGLHNLFTFVDLITSLSEIFQGGGGCLELWSVFRP